VHYCSGLYWYFYPLLSVSCFELSVYCFGCSLSPGWLFYPCYTPCSRRPFHPSFSSSCCPPSLVLYCNLCDSLVISAPDDTSPSSSLLTVLLFPREGRLHLFPVVGCDGVDVVTDAAVVLFLVFLGCPVDFLVGLMYRYCDISVFRDFVELLLLLF
jgi:hypothetical protein